MQVLLKSFDTKALDNAVKELCKVSYDIRNIKLLRRVPLKESKRIIICSSIDVSVISKLEVPAMVHISVRY